MQHKCRVYKIYYDKWVTQCSVHNCFNCKGYIESITWEEAMLEALVHRIRNL